MAPHDQSEGIGVNLRAPLDGMDLFRLRKLVELAMACGIGDCDPVCVAGDNPDAPAQATWLEIDKPAWGDV